MCSWEGVLGRFSYRTAALCSEVWQKRKRTSLRDLAKANLADIFVDVNWGERRKLAVSNGE